MEPRNRYRWWFGAAIGLAVLILTVRSPAVALIDPDEARLARTSVEMLRSGDLVLPTFQGEPRIVKPPLLHWLHLPLLSAFGAGEFAARLPAVLATLGALALVALVARRRFGDEGACWAAAIFATLPLTVAGGRVGTFDALLAVHVTAAIALDLLDPDGWRPRRGGAYGALLGLGFLAKGPVALILPPLMMLAGRTATRLPLVPKLPVAGAAIAACLALIAPWGIAFLTRLGPDRVLALIREEAVTRYTSGTDHVEPAWFYAPVLLIALFPFFVPLISGSLRALRRGRTGAGPTAPYCAAAFWAGVAFFTLSKGKLPSYLLPLMPMAALVVTWELAREAGRKRPGSLVATLIAASMAAFAVLLPLAAARFEAVGSIDLVATAGAALWGLCALVALIGALRAAPRIAYGAAVAAAGGFMLLCAGVLLPEISRQRSARELCDHVSELRSGRQVVVVDMKVPSLAFYLDRPIEEVDARDLAARLNGSDHPLYVVDPDDLTKIPDPVEQRLRELGRRGKYRVYERR